MKKIGKCNDCSAFKIYRGKINSVAHDGTVVCEKEMRIIGNIGQSNNDDLQLFDVPDWCPLEDTDNPEIKTVILNGLEWMTENLTGHGGMQIDENNWYYSLEQVKNVVKEIGDGWRLPTHNEFEYAVTKIDPNRLWSESKDIMYLDKEKNLILQAVSEYNLIDNVFCAGKKLIYWTTVSDRFCHSVAYINGYLDNFGFNCDRFALPVRLVRDIKK